MDRKYFTARRRYGTPQLIADVFALSFVLICNLAFIVGQTTDFFQSRKLVGYGLDYPGIIYVYRNPCRIMDQGIKIISKKFQDSGILVKISRFISSEENKNNSDFQFDAQAQKTFKIVFLRFQLVVLLSAIMYAAILLIVLLILKKISMAFLS